MRRRDFIAGVTAVALLPSEMRAQQAPRRVALLLAAYSETDKAAQTRIAVFRSELRRLGWTDEGNVRLELRWGDGNSDRGKALAEEVVRSMPEAIVVSGDPGLAALHRLTKTIPIVFTQVSDPVDSGFVVSLARPGGNVTGFQNFEPEIGGKWLSLLKEVAPQLRQVYLLSNSGAAPHVVFLRAAESVAPSLGVALVATNVRNADEIDRAITTIANEPETGLIVLPHPITIANRTAIHALTTRYRLPAIFPYRYFATDGGLMSYGPDQLDQWRGAATYIDRILRGEEKPADLPVQAPTKYELVINLKTAKALGLAVPPTLLTRADGVVE